MPIKILYMTVVFVDMPFKIGISRNLNFSI